MEYAIVPLTVNYIIHTLNEHKDIYGNHNFESLEMPQTSFNELKNNEQKKGNPLNFADAMAIEGLPIIVEPRRYIKNGFVRFVHKVVRCPLVIISI